MAITSVELLFEGRGGNADWMQRRTYTRIYEVLTDDATDDAVTAGTAPGSLPVMGQSHPEDPAAVVVSRAPSQDSDRPTRWLVAIGYDTQPPGSASPESAQGGGSAQPVEAGGGETAPGEQPENPLSRPAKWRVTFERITETARDAYKVDENGDNIGGTKPIANSAGDPFDPGIQVDRSYPVITITKNLPNLELAKMEELENAVNKTNWKGRAPRTVRCVGVEAESNWENGYTFWAYTFSLAIKSDNWDERVLDAGYRWRENVGSTVNPDWRYYPFLDESGNPRKGLLDGNGGKLADGEPEVFKLFSVRKQRDFNALLGV